VWRNFRLGAKAVGFHNLTQLGGGFFPNGLWGTWMAVIMGVLSFNGIEVIAVTSGEVPNPEIAIPRALRTMVVRLFLFYILALGIVVTIVPWTETGAKIVAESPFVRVFAHTGIAHAAGIMNFVVISAALSSMNTNVYLCSRMLFSLSRGTYAPKFLGQLSGTGSADRRDSSLGWIHSRRGGGLQIYTAGLQLSARRRPVRRDDRVDRDSAESSELSPFPQGRRSSRAHAAVSIYADRRPDPARGAADHHGARHGVLERLLDCRRSMAALLTGAYFIWRSRNRRALARESDAAAAVEIT
jgi:hypothetical protein